MPQPNTPSPRPISLAAVPRFTRRFTLLLTVYTVWAIGVLVVNWYNTTARPEGRNALELCPMKLVAGLPCPACGGTRTASALASFDLPLAWHHNPLLTLAIPLVTMLLMLRIATGRALHIQLKQPARRMAWAGVLLALLLNWVWVIRVGN